MSTIKLAEIVLGGAVLFACALIAHDKYSEHKRKKQAKREAEKEKEVEEMVRKSGYVGVAGTLAAGTGIGQSKTIIEEKTNLPKYKKGGDPVGHSFEDLAKERLAKDLKKTNGKNYEANLCPEFTNGPDIVASNKDNCKEPPLKFQAKATTNPNTLINELYDKTTGKYRYDCQRPLVPADMPKDKVNKLIGKKKKAALGGNYVFISSVTRKQAEDNVYRFTPTALNYDMRMCQKPVSDAMKLAAIFCAIVGIGLLIFDVYKQRKQNKPASTKCKNVAKHALQYTLIAGCTVLVVGGITALYYITRAQSYRRIV